MHNQKSRLFDAFVLSGIKRLSFPKQDVVTGLELILGNFQQGPGPSVFNPKPDEPSKQSNTKYVDVSCGFEELWLKIRVNEANKTPIAHIDIYEAELEKETGITVCFH